MCKSTNLISMHSLRKDYVCRGSCNTIAKQLRCSCKTVAKELWSNVSVATMLRGGATSCQTIAKQLRDSCKAVASKSYHYLTYCILSRMMYAYNFNHKYIYIYIHIYIYIIVGLLI